MNLRAEMQSVAEAVGTTGTDNTQNLPSQSTAVFVEREAQAEITMNNDMAPDLRPDAPEADRLPDAGRPAPSRRAAELLDCKSLEGGVVALSLVSMAGDKPSILFADRYGNLHAAQELSAKIAGFDDVNLVATEALRDMWALHAGSDDVRLGKNVGAEWTLGGEDTYYIVSELAPDDEPWIATATLIDPITGGHTPVTPLSRYRFMLRVATHRCAARIRIEFHAVNGKIISGLMRDVDRSFRGGTSLHGYEAVEIDFVAPPGAALVAIHVDKGRTDQKTSSYLFAVCPSLQMVRAGTARDPIVLPMALLEQARARGGLEMVRLLVRAPSELLDGSARPVGLIVRLSGRQFSIPDMDMEKKSVIDVASFSLENNMTYFSGRARSDDIAEARLAVFVDGAMSGSKTIEIADHVFEDTIAIDSRHLDGCAHLIELRHLPNMAVLSSLYELLPLHITPWFALQSFARPPLDGTLAPAARHHFRSFQAWFETVRADGAREIPPLSDLHAELLHGFNKRASYPRLEFPRHDNPTVSIVVPVHNKFEITYFCLCALRFAFNHTPFEIIVVDDGSSDETENIENYVGGVRTVMHDSAQGFVNACNDGAAEARGEFVLFLNNDTEVTAHWLDELVSVFRNFSNVGLVGSKLVYPDGRLQEAGGIVWKSGNPWNVGRHGNADDPAYNYLRQVDYLSGAAIMLPRAIWKKIGGFSQEFAPAYFEDTDLAMKVREAGHFVVYVPTSSVYHFEGQSAGTSIASGMKRFQEVNRPKFKRKWSHIYNNHGMEGEQPDREKDRNIAFRVLFIDQHVPFVDNDAGSYAAFQEVRLFQSQGAKVTFLPRNLAWMDRHTLAMERMGVECLYAPYVMDFVQYCRDHASEYDVVFVCRYKIAEQVIPLIKTAAPRTKIVVNLADLHFLRELREVAAGTAQYTRERAEETRKAELAVVMSSDLTFSYSDVELAVLESHVSDGASMARLPWVVETKERKRAFAETKNILFVGGFGHPPNLQAVRFFAIEVMPLVRDRLPGVTFDVVGSGAKEALADLDEDAVRVLGYVADLDETLQSARVFVAPLLAGAGIKGKVLDAIACGVPSVLSPLAVEGTGLVDGADCLLARSPEAWADAVVKLYQDEKLWNHISKGALNLAGNRYSFKAGVETFREALAKIEIFGREDWGLVYRHARPQHYGF